MSSQCQKTWAWEQKVDLNSNRKSPRIPVHMPTLWKRQIDRSNNAAELKCPRLTAPKEILWHVRAVISPQMKPACSGHLESNFSELGSNPRTMTLGSSEKYVKPRRDDFYLEHYSNRISWKREVDKGQLLFHSVIESDHLYSTFDLFQCLTSNSPLEWQKKNSVKPSRRTNQFRKLIVVTWFRATSVSNCLQGCPRLQIGE